MISEATFNGRSRELSFGSSTPLGYGYRVISSTATAGSLILTLPDARNLRRGQGVFLLFNNGPTNAFAVRDNGAGVLVATLAIGTAVLLDLLTNTTAAGTWMTTVRSKLT